MIQKKAAAQAYATLLATIGVYECV